MGITGNLECDTTGAKLKVNKLSNGYIVQKDYFVIQKDFFVV